MTHDDRWFRSSRCGHGPTCVEVAFLRGVIGLRDSKNPASALMLDQDTWRDFIGMASRAFPPVP
jgi:hypothetical protein